MTGELKEEEICKNCPVKENGNEVRIGHCFQCNRFFGG